MTRTEQTRAQGAHENVPTGPQFSGSDEGRIHRAACQIIAAALRGDAPPTELESLDAGRTLVMGAFVTLKRNGKLRACCGTLGRPMPLAQAVVQAALRTATEDARFPTISPTELPHLQLDVTLLYAFQPMTAQGRDRIGEVELGRHGLQIQRGQQAGLLLPSVPIEWGWDTEQFLEHLCRKAGLPGGAWMDEDAILTKFEGYEIEGPFCPEVARDAAQKPLQRFSQAEIAELAAQCLRNVVALAQGATPNYYLPGCPDGTVQLISLTIYPPDSAPQQLSQMSLRPGVPLQATLYRLAEAAAGALNARQRSPAALQQLRLGLTVLSDPAMHGTVAEPDLEGVDATRRALLVIERSKTAWIYDPHREPQQLLDAAARDAEVANPPAASVFSLAAVCTESRSTMSHVARPSPGPQVRPAAVAGMFYPGDSDQLAQLIDQMLADGGEVSPEPWSAVMVPHAGLVYSGRLAAETFRRVQIPEAVIIIAPRHTRYGVDWAVTPHRAWELPGCQVPGDPELAARLADGIPGLKLDAAAHRQEHAIEVQLPLLARLAPASRVVGIVLGASDRDDCRRFATGLAGVLRDLPQRPLLVISSDLNHFADDRENRRLDEIALQAIETLEPDHVFDTIVNRHRISMCGVRPCVVVMETLRQLGLLNRCQRIGYATSAEVSGDTSRVVGYAGLLFG